MEHQFRSSPTFWAASMDNNNLLVDPIADAEDPDLVFGNSLGGDLMRGLGGIHATNSLAGLPEKEDGRGGDALFDFTTDVPPHVLNNAFPALQTATPITSLKDNVPTQIVIVQRKSDGSFSQEDTNVILQALNRESLPNQAPPFLEDEPVLAMDPRISQIETAVPVQQDNRLGPSFGNANVPHGVEGVGGPGQLLPVDDDLSISNFSWHTAYSSMSESPQPSPLPIARPTRVNTGVKKNDVVLGRGELANKHEGNKKYRKKRDALQAFYLATKRADRRAIAHQLMNWVHKKGGAFLKKDKKTGCWNEVSKKKALEKCSHALREKKARTGRRHG